MEVALFLLQRFLAPTVFGFFFAIGVVSVVEPTTNGGYLFLILLVIIMTIVVSVPFRHLILLLRRRLKRQPKPLPKAGDNKPTWWSDLSQ